MLVLQAGTSDVPAERLLFVRAYDDAVDIKSKASKCRNKRWNYKRKWPTLCGCSTCLEPSARVQEAKLLSEEGTPSEVASKAGGVEIVTLSGTGCAGEAAK